jgi:hypothetical protein
MPPANNQLFTFNDVANEVSAGRMVWSGSAQSGTSIITWSQFITYVSYDGTNPVGYVSNQCVRYDDALARAVVVPPPFSLTITPGSPVKCTCNWSLPVDPSRTGVEIVFYASTTYPTGTLILLSNTTTTKAFSGLASGETVSYTLRDKQGTSTYSNYVNSPSGTVP